MASVWVKPDAAEPGPIDPAALAALAGPNAAPVFAFAPADVEPGIDRKVIAGLAGTQAKLPPIFAPTTPTVRMPTGLERAQQAQDAKLSKLVMQDQNPWGTATNHPGFWGKLGHALNVATGGVNRRGFEENDLIKQLDQEALAAQQQGLLGSEAEHNRAESGLAGAQQAHAEEETREMPQTLESELGLRAAEQWKAEHPWADLPGNEPLTNVDNIQKGLNDLYMSANPGAKAVPPEFTLPPNPTKDDLARVQANLSRLDTQNMTNAQRSDAAAMRMLMYHLAAQKAAESGPGGEAGLDRESTRFAKPYQTADTAAAAQLDKIQDAKAMINGSAASQALGIPKLLTALVSGQGSGVRITQAELNMVARARGVSGDIEGAINRLSGKGTLTREQQQQFTEILDDVSRRVLLKQQIANDTLDAINSASSRQDIVAADKRARALMAGTEKYLMIARGEQGNYAGSNDGKTWIDLETGKEVK
jgi:hypothetical protein